MKKIFILSLLTTSAFGFEYNTDQFNKLSNNTYDACLEFYVSEMVSNKIDVKKLPDDKIDLLNQMCVCQSYCLAEKIDDMSYMYDARAKKRLGKTLNKCIKKCNKALLK